MKKVEGLRNVQSPELVEGAQFSAHLIQQAGGREGPKYVANIGDYNLFIVGRNQVDMESGIRQLVKWHNEDFYAPIEVVKRLCSTVIINEILASTGGNVSSSGIPNINIVPIQPLAITNLSDNTDIWGNADVKMTTTTCFDQEFWNNGRENVDLIRKSISIPFSKGFDSKNPIYNLGVALPFVDNFNENDLTMFAISASVPDQLALNLELLKLNKKFVEAGLFWQDQGKSSDNYLAGRNDKGDLILMLSDYDLTIFDHERFSKSEFYWDEYQELFPDDTDLGIASLNNFISQISFGRGIGTDLYKYLRDSAKDLSYEEAIDFLINKLETLAIQISGADESEQLKIIERFIYKPIINQELTTEEAKLSKSEPSETKPNQEKTFDLGVDFLQSQIAETLELTPNNRVSKILNLISYVSEKQSRSDQNFFTAKKILPDETQQILATLIENPDFDNEFPNTEVFDSVERYLRKHPYQPEVISPILRWCQTKQPEVTKYILASVLNWREDISRTATDVPLVKLRNLIEEITK